MLFFFYKRGQNYLSLHFLQKTIKLLQFLTWFFWLLRSSSQSSALCGVSLLCTDPGDRSCKHGTAAFRGWPQDVVPVTTWEKAADQTSSCLVSIFWNIYVEKKVYVQKTPKHGIPAPLELTQPIPSVSSTAVKALPYSHHTHRAAGQRWGPSTAGLLHLHQCSNHQRLDFKLRDISGEVSERLLCKVISRSLWCDCTSQLAFQACFVK